ncbi:MAG: hypothetical protein EHM20_06335 [Alphaproteobacteria bacterium]|nr:MAG: hypothetical protein EHM20_06335 [Alphaproteobacteria bacterium]
MSGRNVDQAILRANGVIDGHSITYGLRDYDKYVSTPNMQKEKDLSNPLSQTVSNGYLHSVGTELST